MIVKVESKDGSFQRWDNCLTACFSDIENGDGPTLICSFDSGKDSTYPLDKDDKIYLMNDEGKTIDKIVV